MVIAITGWCHVLLIQLCCSLLHCLPLPSVLPSMQCGVLHLSLKRMLVRVECAVTHLNGGSGCCLQVRACMAECWHLRTCLRHWWCPPLPCVSMVAQSMMRVASTNLLPSFPVLVLVSSCYLCIPSMLLVLCNLPPLNLALGAMGWAMSGS